jgi:hypothetical protein
MGLLQAIALLCQVSAGGATASRGILNVVRDYQTQCHHSYLNCVSKRRSVMKEKEALEKCILEK